MHPHVVEACAALQQRIARTQSFNQWETDQAEEALIELVNNPNRSDLPSHQVRNALSNASKKLKRRFALEEQFFPSLPFGADSPINNTIAENGLDIASVMSRMATSDRILLELAADGSNADEIAPEVGLSILQVRHGLSRARARARTLWMGGPS